MVVDQGKIWQLRFSCEVLIPKARAYNKILWGSSHQCASQSRAPSGNSMHYCWLQTAALNVWEISLDNVSCRIYLLEWFDRFDRWNQQLVQRLREGLRELVVPCRHHRRHHLSDLQDCCSSQPQQGLRRLLAAPPGCLPSLKTQGRHLFVTNNPSHRVLSDRTRRKERGEPYLLAIWSQSQISAEFPWLLPGKSQPS